MIPSPEDLERGNEAAALLFALAADLDSRLVIVPRDKDGVALGLVLATADRELCTTCGEPCQCGWWPDGCDHDCADDADWVTR